MGIRAALCGNAAGLLGDLQVLTTASGGFERASAKQALRERRGDLMAYGAHSSPMLNWSRECETMRHRSCQARAASRRRDLRARLITRFWQATDHAS